MHVLAITVHRVDGVASGARCRGRSWPSCLVARRLYSDSRDLLVDFLLAEMTRLTLVQTSRADNEMNLRS